MSYKNPEDQKECWKRHYRRNKQLYIDKSKERKKNSIAFLVEYLKSHPCIRCGQSDIRVLDFDHLRDKDDCVSTLARRGAGDIRLLQEIDKCQVLCSNCHRIVTWERKQPSSIIGSAPDFESGL